MQSTSPGHCNRSHVLLGCAVALAAVGCGSGSDAVAGYAELAAQARAVQAEASALGVDTPCTADASCSALVFTGPCFNWYAPLSLASPNVDRAVALAAQQRQLMEDAMRAPDFVVPPCVPPPYYQPAPACVQAQCTLR
jgi:hypothetical protein